jgi:SAM-dependent methyltransferase
MCHTSVLTWAASLPPSIVRDRAVLEVGAYDVNGSVRPTLEAHGPTSYLGVDQSDGPGVDVVADVADLPAMYPDGFDLVVSTEMLEHVPDWRTAIRAMVDLVAPGGHLAITTRSPGFPEHRFPIDTFRYTPEQLREILELAKLDVTSCYPDPEQPGAFVVASKPTDWKAPRRKDWWPGILLPLWDGSIEAPPA